MVTQSNLLILVVSNVVNTTEVTGMVTIKVYECQHVLQINLEPKPG